MITIFLDGAAEPNPGQGASAFVALRENITIKEEARYIGDNISNNQAEYIALEDALFWLDKQPAEEVTIYSDSMLLVNQMAGKWNVKGGSYRPHFDRCIGILIQMSYIWHKNISFKWIPREQNLAHELSAKPLKERGIIVRR